MATAKKYPEFELPTLMLETVKKYLGTAKMAQLSAKQRHNVAQAITDVAGDIGEIIAERDPDKLVTLPAQGMERIKITEADRPD